MSFILCCHAIRLPRPLVANPADLASEDDEDEAELRSLVVTARSKYGPSAKTVSRLCMNSV